MFVKKLVCMQRPVHPINADFNETKVKYHGEAVHWPSTNLLNSVVHACPSLLDQPVINNRQQSVDKETGLR